MDFQTVYEKLQDYYDQIPQDTISKMAKSALYTFTGTYLFSKKIPTEPFNLARPLCAAGIATLASLIYALTVPLFNLVFGDDHLLLSRECIKQVVNITLTSAVVGFFTPSKVNMFALPLLGSISINLFKSGFDTFPLVAETWFNDQQFAEEMRELYKQLGIDATPGTSSVFINFGIFPAIGLSE